MAPFDSPLPPHARVSQLGISDTDLMGLYMEYVHTFWKIHKFDEWGELETFV